MEGYEEAIKAISSIFSSLANVVSRAFKGISKLFQSKEVKFLARVAEQEETNSTKISFKITNHKKHILRVRSK